MLVDKEVALASQTNTLCTQGSFVTINCTVFHYTYSHISAP